MVRALLIEFNLRTGERAGGISPRDPKLPCHGWQDLASDPAREIRLVEDDRDLGPYSDVPGVTILEGADEVNEKIDELVPDRFKVVDEGLMLEHMREEGIKLKDYAGQEHAAIIKDLHAKGIVGISQRKPQKVK